MSYSPDMDDQQPAETTGKSRRASLYIKLLGLFGAMLVCAMTAYWVAQKFPDKVKSLIISVDRFGITEVAASEQRRIRTINRLSLTYEERQVLINRTVFLGASREMVYLALGNPACVEQDNTSTAAATEHWVYYIEGERRPTRLAFQNNELINAGKVSGLGTCK